MPSIPLSELSPDVRKKLGLKRARATRRVFPMDAVRSTAFRVMELMAELRPSDRTRVLRQCAKLNALVFFVIALLGCTDAAFTPAAPELDRAPATIVLVVLGDSRAIATAQHGDPWALPGLELEIQNLARGGEVLRSYASSRHTELIQALEACLHCWLVLQAAGNDLIQGAAPGDVYAIAAELIQEAHARRVRVVIGTVLPATPTAGISLAFDGRRRRYNALVHRNRAGADAVASLDEQPVLGRITAASDTALYYDGHHLTAAANRIAAAVWARAIQGARP